MNISGEQRGALIASALEVRKRAYCPYSKYSVGAALMTRSGEVFVGCNVENASYSLTNCAEKTAICSAIAQGKNDFVAIAIVTRESGLPCGSCRQVLNEFCPQDLQVICCNERGDVCLEQCLAQILPHAFGPKNLQ